MDIAATATRGGKQWTARFTAEDRQYSVAARKFADLPSAIGEALEADGIRPGHVVVASAYEDAKRGADQATAEAEAAAHTAYQIRRSLIRKMRADGLTQEDIASILGISHQRVSQLGK